MNRNKINNIVLFEINKFLKENIESEYQVYHGTHANFDEFDTKFMGTGEGGQAYGWGIYVSNNRTTSEIYADIAARNNINTYGHIHAHRWWYIGMKDESLKTLIYKAEELVNAFGGIEEAKKGIRLLSYQGAYNKAAYGSDYDMFDDEKIKIYSFILSTSNDKWFDSLKDKRYLYTVDIPDDNGRNYIDWGQPIGEEMTTYILNSAFGKNDYRGLNYTGDKIYFLLMQKGKFCGNTPKDVSQFLSKIGFVGIKVPTGYKHGGDDNGTNYVIFDPKNVKIMNKEHY